MSNREIQLAWERAYRMAESIFEAHALGIHKEQSRKEQKSLAVWLKIVREGGIVYNGNLDEYVTMKI